MPTTSRRITDYDRQLLTAVVNLAEHAGKPVKPLIVPTNEPFYALAQTAKTIGGPGADHGPVEQVPARGPARRRGALLVQRLRGQARPAVDPGPRARTATSGWTSPAAARSPSPARRPPRSARLLADLRKSWHGVEKLLMAYDGSPLSADFLDTVMSFLDPAIARDADRRRRGGTTARGRRRPDRRGRRSDRARRRAGQRTGPKGRRTWSPGEAGQEIVRAAIEGQFDAIFMSLRGVYRRGDTTAFASNTRYVLENAPCRVILGFAPKSIPASSPAALISEYSESVPGLSSPR